MKIFIASAMGRQDAGTRAMCLSIRSHLRDEYGEDSVYLACDEHPTPTSCYPPREAFDESLSQIRQADVFVLFSPEGPASSGALVEVGLALALGKPILALVSSTEALPYFLWLGTETMTHLLTVHTQGVPMFWDAGETYFRFIRMFIELRVQGLAGDGPQREARPSNLDRMRKVEVELLKGG